MYNLITIDEYLKKHMVNNPKENKDQLKEALVLSVKNKQNRGKCNICGQPVWALGSAIVGWDGCFTCITGEADSSEDFEVY